MAKIPACCQKGNHMFAKDKDGVWRCRLCPETR
jgi:hypothetical protein